MVSPASLSPINHLHLHLVVVESSHNRGYGGTVHPARPYAIPSSPTQPLAVLPVVVLPPTLGVDVARSRPSVVSRSACLIDTRQGRVQSKTVQCNIVQYYAVASASWHHELSGTNRFNRGTLTGSVGVCVRGISPARFASETIISFDCCSLITNRST